MIVQMYRLSPLLTPYLACLLFSSGLSAANVAGLYSAEVEQAPGGNADAAFEQALDKVLLKVTGRQQPLTPEARAQLGNPSALVRQYRNTAPGMLEVGFDPVALRRALDAAGLPVWGDERPSTLVWLAMDTGRGQREILPAADPLAGQGRSGLPTGGDEPDFDTLRDWLLASGEQRGLPLILPLVDSTDLGTLGFADLWGDFAEPVEAASARYQADAILIGRVRGPDPAQAPVRWTLIAGDERAEWQGDIAAGPNGAADYLAARLSATADAARLIRVQVSGVGSLRAFGQVFNYLDGLAIVEQCSVDQVAGDEVLFGLQVRGGPDRLMRSIALGRRLNPRELAPVNGSADLYYLLVDG